MTTMRMRETLLKLGYALLFVGVLPALLAWWAVRLDQWVRLPVPDAAGVGSALAAAGGVLMLAGMFALWRYGGGLPMSAFPPERLVARGVYRVVADPLYVGAVAVSVGISLYAASAAGLWIVSPVLALACTAWVLGFEREHTRAHFGAVTAPLLRLPADTDAPPTTWQRAAVYALVLAPWLVGYLAVEFLGAPADAPSSYLAVDASIPVIPWSEGVYAAVYPMVLLAPLFARRQRDLHRFARRGLWATACILLFYLVLPLVADPKPIPGRGAWQELLAIERVGDSPVTAFPAFHVVWACLAASLYAATWRAGRVLWLAALAIAASCVTVGLHSVADVAAGFVAYALVARGGELWAALRRVAERGANSWAEWRVGPVRLMSHGLFIGLAVFLALPIVTWLGGPSLLWWTFAATMAGAVAASVWAQVIEGSPQLLRPFGYFGGVIGLLLTVIASMFADVDTWKFLAAYTVALAFGQGIGRLRCLVNGCCHGAPAPSSVGIAYTHPQPRPTRLAHLGGIPIHPTQLYAMLWLLVVGFALTRLWLAGAPMSFIAGMYFVLVGLGRFVEEHYRGEPQTAVIAGFRMYQWLTLAFVVGGAALSAFRSASAPAPTPIDGRTMLVAVLTALIGVASFGADVPSSNRRFSRLA